MIIRKMFRKSWVLLLLVVVSGLGCAPSAWNKEMRINHALLVGYDTICKGGIEVSAEGGKEYTTRLIVGAGQQAVTLLADSGPDAEIDPVASDPAYQCSWITQHTVTFDAKASKVYRFYSDRQRSGDYLIRVLEGDDLDQVEMVEVPSQSKQTRKTKHCQFYLDC